MGVEHKIDSTTKVKLWCLFNPTSLIVLLNFFVTVKAAPHECVNRTGLLKTWVKDENEV